MRIWIASWVFLSSLASFSCVSRFKSQFGRLGAILNTSYSGQPVAHMIWVSFGHSARTTHQFLCLPCLVLLDNLLRKAGYVFFYCVFHINIVIPRVFLNGPWFWIEVSRFEQRLCNTKVLMMNIWGSTQHIPTHSSVTSPALRFLSEIKRALRASEFSTSDMRWGDWEVQLTKQMIETRNELINACGLKYHRLAAPIMLCPWHRACFQIDIFRCSWTFATACRHLHSTVSCHAEPKQMSMENYPCGLIRCIDSFCLFQGLDW